MFPPSSPYGDELPPHPGCFFLGVYIHDRREESTLAALSGLPVMLWAQTAQADNFDSGKFKRERREWWRSKIYHVFKRAAQSRVCYATYIYNDYLDPPRGAKWMVRGAILQSLRV